MYATCPNRAHQVSTFLFHVFKRQQSKFGIKLQIFFFADLINMKHGNSNSKVAVLNGLKRIYFIYITGSPSSSCEMIILRNTVMAEL